MAVFSGLFRPVLAFSDGFLATLVTSVTSIVTSVTSVTSMAIL